MPVTSIEAESNEKNGWKTVSEDEFYATEKPVEVAAVVRDIVAEYTDKFGKPPHHKMKPESIIAKLDE